MFEKEAEDSFNCKKVLYKWETDKCSYIDGFKDGAKSREKRIAELEKQLDIERNERNLFQERSEDILENYYCDHKGKCTELEKENTELKKQLEMSNKVYNDNLDYSHHIEGQLTKAENLIKKMLYEYLRLCVIKKETIAEAKQFLKE